MSSVKSNVKVVCYDCGITFETTYDTYRTTKDKANKKWRCKKCRSIYRSKMMREREANRSEEEKRAINVKRSTTMKNITSKISEEEWNKRNTKRRDTISRKSPEEIEKINTQISNTLKKNYKNETKSEKEKRSQIRKKTWSLKDLAEIESYNEKRAIKRAAKSPEELQAISQKISNTLNSKTEEEKKTTNSKRLDTYNSKSEEEKKAISDKKRETWKCKPQEEIDESLRKREETLATRSDEEIMEYRKKISDGWHRKPIKERQRITEKHLKLSHNNNNLHKRFEDSFNNSHLVNDYYIKKEDSFIVGDIFHHWDYSIYDKRTNGLVMVVDLDGKFFHADECDYDGLYSKEEYDEKRALTVPNGVKHFIIQEQNFSRCFEEMLKLVMMNYNEYVENMFKMFRLMPFPEPRYSDIELVNSYQKLSKMKCNDKYHKNISLNTRNGDRLINHFHPSIYKAFRKNKISPYEAWYNDELLKKCIKNRIIYQSYLNPNKILQGFNISKVAPKVSVFSAGRAKLLINKYLNEYNEVFDPFSGFSGRMLGAVSLCKKYIGHDISLIHTNESNRMISFLKYNEKYLDNKIDAIVNQVNILDDHGEYECLFTCPPYSDKEQWLDVPIDTRSCDDWIDECLSRYKCKKYLFVVDHTEKYKDYIVNNIDNRYHLNKNKEYVILIKNDDIAERN